MFDYTFVGYYNLRPLGSRWERHLPSWQYASLLIRSSCYITSHTSHSSPCLSLTNLRDCVVHAQSYQRSTV
nr:MAG TPA: hypothetical protein [Caudoviricetes sp.]